MAEETRDHDHALQRKAETAGDDAAAPVRHRAGQLCIGPGSFGKRTRRGRFARDAKDQPSSASSASSWAISRVIVLGWTPNSLAARPLC